MFVAEQVKQLEQVLRGQALQVRVVLGEVPSEVVLQVRVKLLGHVLLVQVVLREVPSGVVLLELVVLGVAVRLEAPSGEAVLGLAV